MPEVKDKSLEQWLWDAACSIRGAQEASKYKDFILPLVFVKRLCDVFDDEINRLAGKLKSRKKAYDLVGKDHSLVRFYLPLRPKDLEKDSAWSIIRILSEKVGQKLTDHLREIAKYNKRLRSIIDRVDFNATTHGTRDIDDDSLSRLIERISEKRLGLKDVEPDVIGRSYEYLIRKFAEGGGQSAGEFYTPKEVGMVMARILDPEPDMDIYDPTTGSAGLLIKCEIALNEKMYLKSKKNFAPLHLYGQEFTPATWAMANMNMVIHDMEGEIEIGDTMKHPKFKDPEKRNGAGRNRLRRFDRVTANPMWNQDWFEESVYENDEYDRFKAGFAPKSSADWAWVQHIHASLNENGRAAVVLDTGAVSRGSGNQGSNKEKDIRKWFVDNDLVEAVLLLPENLFYNTTAPGIVLFLNRKKPKEKKDKIFLLNASLDFEKGKPKNFMNDQQQNKIVEAYQQWKDKEKFCKIITIGEAVKNDYNLSPSRYIHTADPEEYRPIGELLEELNTLDKEAKTIDKELKNIFEKIGY